MSILRLSYGLSAQRAHFACRPRIKKCDVQTAILKKGAVVFELLKLALAPKSSVSMMRLMSIICVLMACVIAIVGLCTNKPLGELSILVGSFLGPAFLGKSIQARSE